MQPNTPVDGNTKVKFTLTNVCRKKIIQDPLHCIVFVGVVPVQKYRIYWPIISKEIATTFSTVFNFNFLAISYFFIIRCIKNIYY